MKTFFKGQKEVAIKASKLIRIVDGNVIVTEAVLDDIINTCKKITEQRNFTKGSTTYNHGISALEGFLGAARATASALIDSGEMVSDKYNLLSCRATAFGKHNPLVNEILQNLSDKEKLEAKQQREENPTSEEAQQPFTEQQMSNIKSEPVSEDPESNVVEETTKDGGRFRFIKDEYEIHAFRKDGTTLIIRLAPEGSWRRTIIKWLKAFCKGAADIFMTVVRGIGGAVSTGFTSFINLFRKNPAEQFEQETPQTSEADLALAAASPAKPSDEK